MKTITITILVAGTLYMRTSNLSCTEGLLLAAKSDDPTTDVAITRADAVALRSVILDVLRYTPMVMSYAHYITWRDLLYTITAIIYQYDMDSIAV